ncbi:O-antigen ligase family protein [Paraburkholderia bannensis]|uniref:O-antigen ligase family protein n=1 Tax=Paraburkholderia bannensis TaxID=765414 RepID=UPI002AC32933|nr:O-antigen ligase family protein [Paraburkholderia bannensis]
MSIVIAVALIVGLPVIPRRWRICLFLPLAVFQIYPPWLVIGQVPVPLAMIFAYAFWPQVLSEARFLISIKSMRLILGIVLVTIVSFLWSVDVRLGLVSLNAYLSFVFVFAGMASQARVDPRWITRGFTAMYLSMIIFAASVVAFRFAPDAKLLFLKTNLASWFISSNTLTSLFSDGRNNVFDPEKSGGFAFVNGNAASTFLGIVAMMALGTARAYGSRLHLLCGLIILCSVPFAGSKAGALLVVPLVGIFALFKIEKKNRPMVAYISIVFCVIALIVFKIVDPASVSSAPSLGSRISDTAETRIQMWTFAVKMFMESPVLGQGFGGWQVEFPAYARFAGVPQDLPPHNTFVYLWSQSGLVAIGLGAYFVAVVLLMGARGMRAKSIDQKGLGAMLMLGYLWLFIQGFGENQGLIGDVHMQPVLATALAIFIVQSRKFLEHGRGKYA